MHENIFKTFLRRPDASNLEKCVPVSDTRVPQNFRDAPVASWGLEIFFVYILTSRSETTGGWYFRAGETSYGETSRGVILPWGKTFEQ